MDEEISIFCFQWFCGDKYVCFQLILSSYPYYDADSWLILFLFIQYQ